MSGTRRREVPFLSVTSRTTLVFFLPRIFLMDLRIGFQTTSSTGPSPCPTPTILSPALMEPSRAIGPPFMTSLISSEPSSIDCVRTAPTPQSDRLMSMSKSSLLSGAMYPECGS